MSRILTALAVLTLIFAMTGCNQAKEPPTGMTPVETVQYYFDQWENKNLAGMNGVCYQKLSETSYEMFYGLKYVNLNSCRLGDRPDDWDEAWYSNPYAHAVVDTEFEVYFNPPNSVMANDTYQWRYYLIKETADSDWRLIMWGAG